MGFIAWIIMGLIVGVPAKWIMPGKDPGGGFEAVGPGIAGTFVVGFIGTRPGLGAVTGVNIGGMLIATDGAILLPAIVRAMKGKK